MEIKVNREIRNYNEEIFLGLSMRQLIFSALAICVAIGVYFLLREVMPLGVHSLCCTLWGAGVCILQRHDRREAADCGHQVSNHPQSIGVPAGKRF